MFEFLFIQNVIDWIFSVCSFIIVCITLMNIYFCVFTHLFFNRFSFITLFAVPGAILLLTSQNIGFFCSAGIAVKQDLFCSLNPQSENPGYNKAHRTHKVFPWLCWYWDCLPQEHNNLGRQSVDLNPNIVLQHKICIYVTLTYPYSLMI